MRTRWTPPAAADLQDITCGNEPPFDSYAGISLAVAAQCGRLEQSIRFRAATTRERFADALLLILTDGFAIRAIGTQESWKGARRRGSKRLGSVGLRSGVETTKFVHPREEIGAASGCLGRAARKGGSG